MKSTQSKLEFRGLRPEYESVYDLLHVLSSFQMEVKELPLRVYTGEEFRRVESVCLFVETDPDHPGKTNIFIGIDTYKHPDDQGENE